MTHARADKFLHDLDVAFVLYIAHCKEHFSLVYIIPNK